MLMTNLMPKKKRKKIDWLDVSEKASVIISILGTISGIGLHVLLWVALIKYIWF